MLARVITLRFNPVMGHFDDGPLRDFIKDKEVLSIRDHFFLKDETPYLTLVVTYALRRMDEQPSRNVETPVRQESSWRGLVTEAELPLFNALRDWRSERCKKEGIPPYVICTNCQFAEMVKTRPQSLAKLAEVDGFGKAKIEKYGGDILAILASSPANPQHTDTPPVEEEISEPEHDTAKG